MALFDLDIFSDIVIIAVTIVYSNVEVHRPSWLTFPDHSDHTASRGFFLAWLLALTKSFVWLTVCRVVGTYKTNQLRY